jgi:hypothetical protein
VFCRFGVKGAMIKTVKCLVLLALLPSLCCAQRTADNKPAKFNFPEMNDPSRLEEKVQHAVDGVEDFFGKPFPASFQVKVHPSRAALDKQWQGDWNMPDFKSECWMVASGVGPKLDLLSPDQWKTEACEHDASDTVKMQNLITHEVTHVFHAQVNPSTDFSDVQGLDWFVEGLATYASGQVDDKRRGDLKLLERQNKIPTSLDEFWKGKHKYGLSGGVVMYIDRKYGRATIVDILPLTRKDEVLAVLKVSEANLIEGFKRYIQSL